MCVILAKDKYSRCKKLIDYKPRESQVNTVMTWNTQQLKAWDAGL
ncbi:hypothetical protein [Bathymodiolus platifrons methanotrophic gill symbiont]|nr:hypothetical protein [Bathymodiolus platifrons methanotrophic gill symbiont]